MGKVKDYSMYNPSLEQSEYLEITNEGLFQLKTAALEAPKVFYRPINTKLQDRVLSVVNNEEVETVTVITYTLGHKGLNELFSKIGPSHDARIRVAFCWDSSPDVSYFKTICSNLVEQLSPWKKITIMIVPRTHIKLLQIDGSFWLGSMNLTASSDYSSHAKDELLIEYQDKDKTVANDIWSLLGRAPKKATLNKSQQDWLCELPNSKDLLRCSEITSTEFQKIYKSLRSHGTKSSNTVDGSSFEVDAFFSSLEIINIFNKQVDLLESLDCCIGVLFEAALDVIEISNPKLREKREGEFSKYIELAITSQNDCLQDCYSDDNDSKVLDKDIIFQNIESSWDREIGSDEDLYYSVDQTYASRQETFQAYKANLKLRFKDLLN